MLDKRLAVLTFGDTLAMIIPIPNIEHTTSMYTDTNIIRLPSNRYLKTIVSINHTNIEDRIERSVFTKNWTINIAYVGKGVTSNYFKILFAL